VNSAGLTNRSRDLTKCISIYACDHCANNFHIEILTRDGRRIGWPRKRGRREAREETAIDLSLAPRVIRLEVGVCSVLESCTDTFASSSILEFRGRGLYGHFKREALSRFSEMGNVCPRCGEHVSRRERKQKRSLNLSVYAGRDGELESRLRAHAVATSPVIEVNLPTCTNQLSCVPLYSVAECRHHLIICASAENDSLGSRRSVNGRARSRT